MTAPAHASGDLVAPSAALLDPALTDPAVAAVLAELDTVATRQIPPRPATADAYASDWRAWCRFLADFNTTLRAADPNAPEIPDTATTYGLFVAFVSWHETQGLAPATIRRRIYGVAVTQRRRGLTVPPESTAAALRKVEIYEEELARTNQPRGRGKAKPAQVRHLRRISTQLPHDALAGIRDRAVLLLGFAIGSRRSDLAALDIDDITAEDEGLVVRIRYGKTGARTVAVPHGTHPATCPVRAVLAWISELGDAGVRVGPLFSPIDRHGNPRPGKRLSPRAIGEIITRTTDRAEIGHRYTGHSLRSGMATESRRAGHDVKTIAAQGGWKENSAVLYGYMHIVDRWGDNALQGIGL
ncbi:tyrosine-type recombinase/integrase [Nocardia amamiensis]|uniref:tyrosine-type recombinase/integrase n=1 Tax=Nocardia amamiensis TaxID=404578 RepID=UPI00082BD1CD|nr:tyrosine-type recombinase/integrase [Nocardia amamiensis]